MSRYIWRHELPVDSRRHVLSLCGEIVSVVAFRLDRVHVFELCDMSAPQVDRVLRVVGAGDPLDEDLVYVGTAVAADGAVAWHVMEEVTPKGDPGTAGLEQVAEQRTVQSGE